MYLNSLIIGVDSSYERCDTVQYRLTVSKRRPCSNIRLSLLLPSPEFRKRKGLWSGLVVGVLPEAEGLQQVPEVAGAGARDEAGGSKPEGQAVPGAGEELHRATDVQLGFVGRLRGSRFRCSFGVGWDVFEARHVV